MRRHALRLSFLALTTLAATAAFATACSDDDDDNRVVTPTPTPDGGGSTPDANVAETTTQPNDGGVAGDQGVVAVLMAVNTGEIDQGTLAQSKGMNADVKAYGSQMVTEHSAANQRASALVQSLGLAAGDNAVSETVKAEGKTILSQLQGVTGMEFDVAYINAQVTQHAKVLNIIDSTLVPAAQSQAMKEELTTLRASVAMHLSHAQMIQAALQDGGMGDGGDGG